ncbi:MAG: peptidoglycan DD-metalloendopeptidase family protein [Cellvibrionaceae bacterium]
MTSKKNTVLSTVYLHNYPSLFRVIGILIAVFLLHSCSSGYSQAPISSRTQPPSTKVLEHIVAPGDTLYSIAWRYGLDYKGLAKVNRIDSSYGIFPGQIIRLEDKTRVQSPPNEVVVRALPAPKKVIVTPPSSTKPKVKEKQAVSPPRVVTKTPVQVARPEKKPTKAVNNTSKPLAKGKIIWRWPAKGKVITNFYTNSGAKKGIDIDGKKGESVIAAASGKVVYAGGGLRAYGKLVIIKHSETYLSAYAHNNRLRVKEGDVVKSGQRIADIGSTGVGVKGKPRLHFQIRKNGKPINPLPLLPKR